MRDTTRTTSLAPEQAEQAWDIITERLEQFVAAWEGGGAPPRLGEFAPPGPPELRRLALIELAKVDLEYRWSRGARRTVEEYLETYPEMREGEGAPCDLIVEEFCVRRQAGDAVDVEGFCRRFPRQAEQIRRLIGRTAAVQTTALYDAARPEGVEPGGEIDDFQLLSRIGKGAFATVFLARQRSLERIVALKVSADRGSEAQTLAQLDHPNIVRVYDQRVLPERRVRLLYMQYVAGCTLQEALRRMGEVPGQQRSGAALIAAIDAALAERGEAASGSATRSALRETGWPEVVCWVGIQLASALDYAHRHGVLHRDVKPANILLTPDAIPKLADFNVSFCSKLAGATPAAYFGGSLAYMSPEQLEACNPAHDRRPESLDGRSDIYGLGVVLWEMAVGLRPFPDEQLSAGWSETLAEMAERRRSGVPASEVERIDRICPRAVRDLLLRCLDPDPERRPASGSELAHALHAAMLPAGRRLFSGAPPSARRFLLPWIALLALVPNALAGVFNYAYNRTMIVERLAGSQDVFWNVQLAVNSVAYPLGIACLVALAFGPVRAAAGAPFAASLPPEPLRRLRSRTVRLGHFAAVIGIVEWLVAAVVYPLAMRAAGVALVWHDYLHFIASLALCGLIAAAYPFFGISVLALRRVYPHLIRHDAPVRSDLGDLRWITAAAWAYLVLAASLPMLAVALLVSIGGADTRMPLGILSAGGVAGFALVWIQARALLRDVDALTRILAGPKDPPELPGQGGGAAG